MPAWKKIVGRDRGHTVIIFQHNFILKEKKEGWERRRAGVMIMVGRGSRGGRGWHYMSSLDGGEGGGAIIIII